MREVHVAGARVMAHTTGPIANQLVRLGVDSIEHGPRLDPETVRLMADYGTAWTPTVWTMLQNIGPALTLPDPIGGYVHGIVYAMQETLALAADLGVPILAGSDEAPHGSLYHELVALHDFGFSTQQTLVAATSTARRLGKETILKIAGKNVGNSNSNRIGAPHTQRAGNGVRLKIKFFGGSKDKPPRMFTDFGTARKSSAHRAWVNTGASSHITNG